MAFLTFIFKKLVTHKSAWCHIRQWTCESSPARSEIFRSRHNCWDFQFEFSQNPIISILRPGVNTSQDANSIWERFKFTSKGCQAKTAENGPRRSRSGVWSSPASSAMKTLIVMERLIAKLSEPGVIVSLEYLFDIRVTITHRRSASIRMFHDDHHQVVRPSSSTWE